MKKLLFVVAFVVAGMASAKNSPVTKHSEKSKETKEVKKETSAKRKKACGQWVGVTAPCGASYSLCTDNYGSWKELVAAAEYFNDVKC